MLKKIGNVYMDPEAVVAVEMDREAMWPAFHLQTGAVIVADAEEDEVVAFLLETGLLQDTRPPESFIELTEGECDELRHLYAMGCSWIARDKDGKAYAYRDRPELRGAYWEADEHPAAKLEAGFGFLEPGGEAPLEILALLAGCE